MTIFRQGDVLIQKIDAPIPTEAQPIAADRGRTILAYGEVTGHAHALMEKFTSLYEWQGDRLLEVKAATKLQHEEHGAIALAPGNYKVTIQKEYSPQAIRNVAD